VFVNVSHFQTSLEPIKGPHSKGWLQALPANIRLGCQVLRQRLFFTRQNYDCKKYYSTGPGLLMPD